MNRTSRLAAVVAVTVTGLMPITAAPAQAATARASSFGLDLTIVSYDWIPRTGHLEVTAQIECPRRERGASWTVNVKQRVAAMTTHAIACTGQSHEQTLVLEPKDGRFHPGSATLQLTTIECISDFCAGIEYPKRAIAIPPPGQSKKSSPR